MSARRKGRKRALDVLFVADVRDQSVTDVLAAETARATHNPDQHASFAFATELVAGFVDNSEEIDRLIGEVSTEWPVARMPAVDRSVLRVAAAELMVHPETPTAVVISEAGELASEYSTDESRGFIQGVLGSLADRVRGTTPEDA